MMGFRFACSTPTPLLSTLSIQPEKTLSDTTSCISGPVWGGAKDRLTKRWNDNLRHKKWNDNKKFTSHYRRIAVITPLIDMSTLPKVAAKHTTLLKTQTPPLTHGFYSGFIPSGKRCFTSAQTLFNFIFRGVLHLRGYGV